jgi:hypothetical protein
MLPVTSLLPDRYPAPPRGPIHRPHRRKPGPASAQPESSPAWRCSAGCGREPSPSSSPSSRVAAGGRTAARKLLSRSRRIRLFPRGVLYRQVNRVFQDRFEAFLGSGLYEELVRQRLMVPHRPVSSTSPPRPGGGVLGGAGAVHLLSLRVVVRPAAGRRPPDSWSCRARAGAGLHLRDASAYNVQFQGGRPVMIDTLSFEAARGGCALVFFTASSANTSCAARPRIAGWTSGSARSSAVPRRHPARAGLPAARRVGMAPSLSSSTSSSRRWPSGATPTGRWR